MTKVPFAWVIQIGEIIASSSNPAAGDFPSYSMGIPCDGQTLATFSATDTCANVEMFSTSTIDNSHTSAFISIADALMAAFIYFDGMLAIYWLAHRLFH
jgi:hypothetical protein